MLLRHEFPENFPEVIYAETGNPIGQLFMKIEHIQMEA